MIDRHHEHCEIKNRGNSQPYCDCGVAAGDPYWLQRKIVIADRLLLGYSECSHYQEWTKRVEKFFKEAVGHIQNPDLSPRYVQGLTVTVHVDKETYKHGSVSVWGSGIRYDDGVSVTLYLERRNGISDSWQECFKRQLKRLRDTYESDIARIEIEDKMEAGLQEMEDTAIGVIARTRKMLEHAGVTYPSSDLTKKFPVLFKTDISR